MSGSASAGDLRKLAGDGRFLVLQSVEGAADRLIHVVLNWTPRRAGS